LQPGGHADGDEDIVRVAMKEAEEETGLRSFTLMSDSIFDIDIHVIPARKDFPEHFHYDIRILLQAKKSEGLTVTNESNDLRWFPLQTIDAVTGNNISIMRMAEKVIALL
jgi:8-oxo-dGTP pyrophosphatase MutT (NUDIX family)